MEHPPHRGTSLYVCMNTLRRNFRHIGQLTDKKVIAVVKSRAYGTSLFSLSDALYDEGCRFFAVATMSAGLALRQHLRLRADVVEQPKILLFGFCPPSAIDQARDHHLSLALFDLSSAKKYNEILSLQRSEDPSGVEKPYLPVHLVVDSGMTRVGFFPHQVVETVKIFKSQLGELKLEGLFTHFARADEPRTEGAAGYKYTMQQWKRFQDVVSRVQRITDVEIIHAANSGAILQYPETYRADFITHVRPGSLLHGLLTDLLWYNPELSNSLKVSHKDHFRQATSWHTMLASVRRMPFTRPVGYGGRYIAKKGEWIGTLPVGYADGLRRTTLDNKGTPNLVRISAGEGQTEIFPVVGVVAMDFCMITFGKHIVWTTMLDYDIRIEVVPFEGMEEFVGELRAMGTENVRVELMSASTNTDPLSAFQIARRWGTIELEVRSGIRNRNSFMVECISTSSKL